MSKNMLKKVLDKVLEKVASKFKIDLVLLHGSYAKGTYIEEFSDVDIIVVSDDFEGVPVGERLAILAELLAGMEKTVEAIAYTKREFIKHMRDFNPLVLDALEYGIPVFKTDFYQEVLKEFKRLKERYKLKPLKKGWAWTP